MTTTAMTAGPCQTTSQPDSGSMLSTHCSGQAKYEVLLTRICRTRQVSFRFYLGMV